MKMLCCGVSVKLVEMRCGRGVSERRAEVELGKRLSERSRSEIETDAIPEL